MNAYNMPRLRTAGGNQYHELLIGDGTEANPFRIYNETTLKKVGTDIDGWSLDKHYLQIQNITLTMPSAGQGNWTAIGSISNRFNGVYDGGGFTILNLTINTHEDNQGMFSFIENAGVVKNLGLIDNRISGGNYTGNIAGYNTGTIQNCFMTGTINGRNYTGGIVGYNGSMVQNCYVTGNISGNAYSGGLVGENYGMVQNCYATGSTNGSGYYVGGVVGYNEGMIQNCYAMNSVNSNTQYVGGITGYSNDTIQNCVALNSLITTSGSSNSSIGRVSGSFPDFMYNNYARADMSVMYNWSDGMGAHKIVQAGLTTRDGANINSLQFEIQNWWQNVNNWTSGGGWNFTNVC